MLFATCSLRRASPRFERTIWAARVGVRLSMGIVVTVALGCVEGGVGYGAGVTGEKIAVVAVLGLDSSDLGEGRPDMRALSWEDGITLSGSRGGRNLLLRLLLRLLWPPPFSSP